jgi:hypothetical protein
MGIATILGLILPAIPGLIDTAENFIKGEKLGVTRGSVVLQMMRTLITGIHATSTPAAPTLPAAQPTEDELRAVMETIFAQKKASGTLGASLAPSGQLYLLQGSITALSMVKVA